ncbi:ATP-dependent RNA helicase HrpA [Aestuariimicrobium sp. T2.26MG-19.2B]|uniref:ATP-dependent RNA helicase HrpA n=1 Tax=Aestuariimicrobium sp. T2.26MG-19.2B TaxID=3040679 RepID=UPI002477CAAD|nr:ATP-dependent RNA helicase HrpA [Aestuariimicrobium sp. T2.26MG-19.2B]CAI9408598.1 hypothetical protein AESSP_02060 [Aestuariimicrobium sp. T2.26MG-19.2B]
MNQPALAALPAGLDLTCAPQLPISARADDIGDLLDRHQVIVVAGETGSGKTTQLPKIALARGRRRIAHTQPRRIAARSVAERLASEINTPLGEVVGYQVRFTRQAGRETRVKVMTDGVLLAEITRDRDLRRYDTIIIDEAHERSLNIDFLLGYLKQLLTRRRDLKVVITSATIDTARFSEHFGGAPVVEVSGRTFPVETRYRPLGDDDDQVAGISAAVEELAAEGPGDILVFLSGEREIRDAAEAVTALKLPETEVLPLYARLSSAEQQRVFQSHTGRRVVLATNVAETSITVPGIRYVVDPGTARVSRYSARTKVQRLPIEPVSQASANQRAGRCGRVAPGICIRLYSEEDYQARPEFTEPEILRTNLASVILQMAQAGLGDIAAFPFVEAPDSGQITDGMRLLDELGALALGNRHHPRLTQTGHALAKLPVDPRLGRMLIEAQRRDCLREVLVIVSALAIPDVRERPVDKRPQADAMHARFTREVVTAAQASTDDQGRPLRHTAHTNTRKEQGPPAGEGGDVMPLVRLWNYLREARRELSGNAFRRMCREEYLNFLRVREWEDLHAQLRELCKELGWHRNQSAAATSDVLTSVLAGLLGHVGLADVREPTPARGSGPRKRTRPGPREYLGARGARFAINPGSVLARNPPPLVMAVELVETSRLWARTVAEIQAEWVEQVAEHVLKRQYSEPHWSSNSGSVVALERVSLYGVPIIAERPVNYARINPVEAREIFIRQGLVEQAWPNRHAVLAHNAEVRRRAEEIEERSRRRDVVVDDQVIFDFYDRRIPDEVVSASHFDAWWRRVDDKRLLELDLDDLIRDDTQTVDAGAFPDHWQVGDLRLDVRYVFEPGSGHDGVTVTIPMRLLNQLTAEPFSWQVPGLRQELATELIRGLPKHLRTNYVPAPNHAREALRWLDGEGGGDRSVRFADELGRALTALTGSPVPADAWRPEAVPDHLRVRFQVTSREGSDRIGKDFDELRQELAAQLSRTLTKATRADRITGQTAWTFGQIPVTVEVGRGGTKAVGYPALIDEGASVGQVVLDAPAAQQRSHHRGVRRLLVLTNPDPSKWVVSHLSNLEKVALPHSPYGSVPELLADARLKTVESLAVGAVGDLNGVRDAAAYEAVALHVRQEQADAMRRVVSLVAQTLTHRLEVQELVRQDAPPSACQDVSRQLQNLIFPNFISATPDPWFAELPRYVQAMKLRLEAAGRNPVRDRELQEQVDELEDEYAAVVDRQPPGPLTPQVEEVAFLIEELRVGLFAQTLRTAVPISPKRVRTALKKL